MVYIDLGLDKVKPWWIRVDGLSAKDVQEITGAALSEIYWYCRNVPGFAKKVRGKYIIDPKKFDFFYCRGKFQPEIWV